MSRRTGIAATLLALVALAGCGSPRMAVHAGPRLSPGDLGLPERACATTGFEIFEGGTTSGRFPAALAVAKLCAGAGQGASGGWRATTLKEEQAVYWNGLFNSLPAVREVIVMSERTPGPVGPGAPSLADAARRLNAGLCLVYGPAAAGPGEAALLGALLDTHDGHPLACVRACATQADFGPKRLDAPRGDERNVDLEYLVARKFERQALQCVTELAARGSAPAAPAEGIPQTKENIPQTQPADGNP